MGFRSAVGHSSRIAAVAGVAVLAAAFLNTSSSASATAARAVPAPAASELTIGSTGLAPGQIKHVFLIILENKSYDATFTGLNQNSYLWKVLRAYLEQEQPPIGWLRLLADEPLAPALRLMHQHPGRQWTLAELARAAGMSRTSFADRFRKVAGTPPLTYLSSWRMVLAQRALRDPDVRVGELAVELGYGSDSAFSNAFKRELGQSPLHYRRQLRATG